MSLDIASVQHLKLDLTHVVESSEALISMDNVWVSLLCLIIMELTRSQR